MHSNYKYLFRTYFDTRLTESGILSFQRNYDIYITNSTATLNNDYLFLNVLKPAPRLRFYQVKQIEKQLSRVKSEQNEVMTFTLRASRQAQVYERKYFSVVDILSQVGGIKTTLMLAGLGFCAAFQQTLLQASLIRKLFHFPARFDSERKDLKSKKEKLKS